MFKLAVLTFNAFSENTYVLTSERGESIIVDPGNNNDRENAIIDQYIEKNNLKPIMIVNTHGHIDHIFGVDYLKNKYGIDFAVSYNDLDLIEEAPTHAIMFGMRMEEVPMAEIDLEHKTKIKFGDTEIEVIPTPGHSKGSMCLLHKESKTLLTGDTLFRGSIGRTDLKGGDYSELMKSIIEKIIPLGGDIKIYPGHGPSSSISEELSSNPFISEVIEGEVSF